MSTSLRYHRRLDGGLIETVPKEVQPKPDPGGGRRALAGATKTPKVVAERAKRTLEGLNRSELDH